nr:putative ribonuclease H-like domain-containing protein [Tanacetum cinerariifolium]
MRPFRCHVTILNTLDHLGKFDGKSDEGFFVGYSTNSKAFRVYNTKTRKVEENLHINFLENKTIIVVDGPKWLFDIDALTESMNYVSVIAGPSQDNIWMSLWNDGSLFDSFSKDSDGSNKDNDGPCKESEIDNQERPNAENNNKDVNNDEPSINTASSNINIASPTVNIVRKSDDFFGADNDMRSLDGVEVDISNIPTTYPVLTTLNTRIHKDYSLDNVIGDMQPSVQTRRMTVTTNEQGFINAIYEEKTHEDLRYEDPDYPDKVYKVEKALCDLHQAPRAWYKTLANYLLENGFHKGKLIKPCSSRDKKMIFCLYKWYEDPDYPDKVYKVEKALCDLHQAPRAWYKTLANYLLDNGFHKGKLIKPCSSRDKKMIFCLYKFSTPMDKKKALLKDSDGDDVDVRLHRPMIRSLMYLTSSRPDIMFDKPQGSEDFYQIVDFLNASHIRYALTENPAIYVSLINQFWRTASARTLDNGKMELNAIVDGQDKTITKASIRGHLKLADANGISTLPTTKFFKQLALMRIRLLLKHLSGDISNWQMLMGEGPTSTAGTYHTPTVLETSPQLQNISITYRKTRTRTRRIGIRIPQSNIPSSVADEAITKEIHDGLGRATTTASSLEAEQGNGNISKTQTKATPSGPSSLRTSSEGGPDATLP